MKAGQKAQTSILWLIGVIVFVIGFHLIFPALAGVQNESFVEESFSFPSISSLWGVSRNTTTPRYATAGRTTARAATAGRTTARAATTARRTTARAATTARRTTARATTTGRTTARAATTGRTTARATTTGHPTARATTAFHAGTNSILQNRVLSAPAANLNAYHVTPSEYNSLTPHTRVAINDELKRIRHKDVRPKSPPRGHIK